MILEMGLTELGRHRVSLFHGTLDPLAVLFRGQLYLARLLVKYLERE